MQHIGQRSAALGLKDHCIYLARDGTMRAYARTVEFLRSAGTNPELMDGRVLSLHQVTGPHDVHYPDWEMHPEGDELLILASGSVSVELREDDMGRTVSVPPQAAFIVPAGIFHRLIVHTPSVLMAITPGHNTVHEKG